MKRSFRMFLLTFISAVVNQEYQLFVHLPGTCSQSKNKAYPCLTDNMIFL